LRSSSVFLLFALIYRKERARTGIRKKIICKSLIAKGKIHAWWAHGVGSELLKKPRF
jgi:hypothetical protein